MSASFCLFILVVFIQRNGEAAPAYANPLDIWKPNTTITYSFANDPPSGNLKAISGVAPASVPRSKLDAENKILKEIRRRVDQVYVSELESSIRDDINQDKLTPQECVDKYGIRDGALKHIIRGVRDVGGVLIRDVQRLGQGRLADLPLVPNVIHGVGETLLYTLCGVEDAVSDVINDGLDEGADHLTKVFVDLLDVDGSVPLQNVPAQIMNITKLFEKVGSEAVEDIFHGIEYGVEDLAEEVGSGVLDVVNDVKGAVSQVETDVMNVVSDVEGVVNGVQTDVSSAVNNVETDVTKLYKDVEGAVGEVETDVTSVVNAVKTEVQMIKGGIQREVSNVVNKVETGVTNLIKDVEGAVSGVETGVTSVVNTVDTGVTNLITDVEGAVSGVETGVTSVVNAADTAVQMIKGGVGSGVGNIVGGLKGGLGAITGLLG